jgi:hypothetical protein
MGEDLGVVENGTGCGHQREVNQREKLLMLLSQVVGLSCAVDKMRAMQEQHKLEIGREFQMLNANICQFVI